MKTVLSAIAISALATGAIANAHDQGQTAVPGQSVKSETVAGAHTLGGSQGNRPADKGPNKSQAGK